MTNVKTETRMARLREELDTLTEVYDGQEWHGVSRDEPELRHAQSGYVVREAVERYVELDTWAQVLIFNEMDRHDDGSYASLSQPKARTTLALEVIKAWRTGRK